jgi:hypothetical protein
MVRAVPPSLLNLKGPNMADNTKPRILSFSSPWLSTVLVASAPNVAIDNAIVMNLSTRPANYEAGLYRGSIAPFHSKSLRECMVIDAEQVLVCEPQQRENLGGLLREWTWYGEKDSNFDRRTPLYVSPQEEIGEVEFNPGEIFGLAHSGTKGLQRFHLKLNLWYAPAFTDCGIHCEHTFLEVHTQLIGTGRMQKFRENSSNTLFEDLIVPAGSTHPPFFNLKSDGTFDYPWHRYFSDSDCVWMAIEFHPTQGQRYEVQS